jgi:hypothetical protein
VAEFWHPTGYADDVGAQLLQQQDDAGLDHDVTTEVAARQK